MAFYFVLQPLNDLKLINHNSHLTSRLSTKALLTRIFIISTFKISYNIVNMKNYHETIKSIGITILFLILATLIGSCFQIWEFHVTNITLIYILSVLLTARFTKGYLYGIIATFFSFLLFNYFFTAPYYTFKIDDPTLAITLIIMTITATVTSALTSKVKSAAHEAQAKEQEANALYQMISYLTDAQNVSEIASASVKVISKLYNCQAAFVCCDENEMPETTFIQQKSEKIQIHRELGYPENFKKRFSKTYEHVIVGEEFYDYPIFSQTKLLAILRIPTDTAMSFDRAQNQLLHSMIESISLVLDRFRSIEEQAHIKEEARQERYRSNLLRAISHDIRTPLSGILGTSEMLMGMIENTDPRYDFAKNIYEDADWLRGLVENILNLTKVQEGNLNAKKELEAVEEVIGAALSVTDKRMKHLNVKVEIPEKLLMVPMDAKLITQVLVNLLDNATKYSKSGQEVKVVVKENIEDNVAEFSVLDNGPGIPEASLPQIFQMFYTADNHEIVAQKGVGLGLSICQSIIEAHGGTICASNRPEGGACFKFTLPLGGPTDEK